MSDPDPRLQAQLRALVGSPTLPAGLAEHALADGRQAQRRRGILAGSGVAVILVIAGGGVLLSPGGGAASRPASRHGATLATGGLPTASQGAPTEPGLLQPAPQRVPDTSGIDGVKAWKVIPPGSNDEGPSTIQATHVTEAVKYFTYPPVGGPHDPTWLNCGAYATTPRWENAVHDEEHGAVIITYRPDLPAEQVAALHALLEKSPTVTLNFQGQRVDTHHRYLDLWPFADQVSPIVLSSWGHQLDVSTADDPRIQAFIKAFRAVASVTPEYGSPCDGGSGPTPLPGTD